MGTTHPGATVPLNESGYKAVASMRNDADMGTFIERVLASEGRMVTNRGGLSGFAPFYSGTKSVQSFARLKDELQGVPWATPPQAAGRPQAPMPVARAVPVAMPQQPFGAGQVASPGIPGGIQPYNPAPMPPAPMMPQASAPPMMASQAFQTGPMPWGGGQQPQPPMAPVAPVPPPYAAQQQAFSSPSYPSGGRDAPLNEDGYQQVAKMRNDQEMRVFVERVLQMDGKRVVNEGGLSGFVPFYSGTQSVQSFQAMCNELRTVPWAASSSGGFGGSSRWKPDALCGGIPAGERCRWLQENQGMSFDAAQAKVMSEFPEIFGSGRNWDPSLDCEGYSARDRAEWLMNNKGMSMQAAQDQVMREYPDVFRWKRDVMCGEHLSGDRADWLMRNDGLSLKQAQVKVMAEYPQLFP